MYHLPYQIEIIIMANGNGGTGEIGELVWLKIINTKLSHDHCMSVRQTDPSEYKMETEGVYF